MTAKVLFFLILSSAVFMCCATNAKSLRYISLENTKSEVEEQLGEPNAVRGSIKNKYGQIVEVWEYKLAVDRDGPAEIAGKSLITLVTLGAGGRLFHNTKKYYWLYFIDDELVQWGEAGDWVKEADRIYEIRFDTTPKIAR